jgi:hypothetical protein
LVGGVDHTTLPYNVSMFQNPMTDMEEVDYHYQQVGFTEPIASY